MHVSILRSGVLQALVALWAGAAWAQLVISESPSAAELPVAAGVDRTGWAQARSNAAGQVMIESPEYPRGLWLHLVDEAGQALAGIQVEYQGFPNGLVALHCVDPAGLRRETLLWTLPEGDPLRLTLQPREPADLPAGLSLMDWQIDPTAEALLEPVAETQLTGWEPVEAFLWTRWQGRSGRVAVLLNAGTSLSVDLDHPAAVGMLLAYLQQLYQLEGFTLGKGTRLKVQVYKGSPTLVEGVTLFISYFFEDAALEAAVRGQLRRPQGPITRQDLASLTFLGIDGRRIHSLAGLERLTALQSLSLRENPLVDVSPLSALANLQSLDLWGTRITNVSPLSGLTNLHTLDLGGNRITDVSPLSGLTNLHTLDLGGNRITDVSPLSGLANLQWLSLRNNQLVDASPLSGLTNLHRLYLDYNQLVDASPLSTLTNLQWLFLDHNRINDASPLSALTNLQRLYLDYNQLVDVSPLLTLTKLKRLDLLGNPLSDQARTEQIPALKARGVHVRDFFEDAALEAAVRRQLRRPQGPITRQDIASLTSLRILPGRIHSLAGLEHFTALQLLSLRNNPPVDMSPLSALTNLQWLYLDYNHINDASPLSTLTNLQRLHLGYNQIVDASPLSALTNLQWLYLNNNQLVDVSPLLTLTKLKRLDLLGNPLSDQARTEQIPALIARGVHVRLAGWW